MGEPTGERRRWWSRADPLVYVVGATALIVYGLHGFNGMLSRDVAIYGYGAQQAVEGVPPYVSVLNRAGPLAHLLPAIGVAAARAAGTDDVLGMRLLFLILSVASVCVAYVLGHAVFATRLAGLAVSTALLSFYGFIRYAGNGPREKTAMVLFVLCAIHAFVKQRWLTGGIWVALSTLTWQPSLSAGIASALMALLALRPSERVPALARTALGCVIPASLSVLYFAANGALVEFVDAALVINARYTTPDPLIPDFARNWELFLNAYGASAWVILGGLAALGVSTLMAVARDGWSAPARSPLVVVGAAGLAAVGWTLRDFNGWPDAFLLLPMAATGVGGLAQELVRRLPTRVALPIAFGWLITATAMATTYSVTHGRDGLDRQRESVAALLGRLPADATIQSIQAPMPLVLSRKENPTRFQMFSRGLDIYVDDTWPGGLDAFGEWVGREQPTIITLQGYRIPYWLFDTLKAEYRRAGRGPGWIWYVHRSVASDVGARPRRYETVRRAPRTQRGGRRPTTGARRSQGR